MSLSTTTNLENSPKVEPKKEEEFKRTPQRKGKVVDVNTGAEYFVVPSSEVVVIQTVQGVSTVLSKEQFEGKYQKVD